MPGTKVIKPFSCSTQQSMKFFLLKNVQNAKKRKLAFYAYLSLKSRTDMYLKFHAELS